jgi:hypothetical protein
MILSLLLTIALTAIGFGLMVGAWRRGQVPTELRGDWWQKFDRDLRAYMAHASMHGGEQ